MIRLNGLEFEVIADYCLFENYANVRVVIPKTYSLTEEDKEKIKQASCVELISGKDKNEKRVVGKYVFAHLIEMTDVGYGIKFVWRAVGGV